MKTSKTQVARAHARMIGYGFATLVFLGAFAIRAAGANLTVQMISEFLFAGPGPKEPYGRLVQGTNGDFYGTTYSGGASDRGTVFKLSTTGAWSTLFSFGGTNGANPTYGGLMRASDGNFYGNCYIGGQSNLGSIFKITHAGVFSNLVSLKRTNGSFPNGWLAQAADDNLYGTTFGGGTSNLGTIYRLTPAGTLTPLFSFSGTNGANPYGGLVSASDGNFYGTTFNGGTSDLGTVFRISTNGAFALLLSFTGTNGSFLGANPRTGLTSGSNGILYGTTESGGPDDAGTVFQISTNGTFTSLFSFAIVNGANPAAGLVEGTDGKLYGTTYSGSGVKSNGTAFRISAAGVFEPLISFDYTNGPGPIGNLALGTDGNFYGTTVAGGYDGVGALFRLVNPPLITSITQSGGNITLTWSSFTNGLYRVEYKSALTGGSWTPLVPDVLATGNLAAKLDSPGSAQRFYRVTLRP